MELNIQNRLIGAMQEPFIIAELSANHGGDIELAKKTIQSAKNSGADAIKLQTYTPDTMTIDCQNPDFLIDEGLWKGRNLYDLYKQASTPYEWHSELFSFSQDIGIICFSTPFDETAIDLLEDLNTPAYKVASFELTDHVLLKNIAKTEKPVIMSSGMATLEEISDAYEILIGGGTKEIAILHCVSGYPTEVKYANLNTISDLKKNFDCVIGLSDHTISNSAAIASISLGACLVEKHFILDRNIGGPDSDFSIEPDQFKELKKGTTEAWESLGSVNYELKGEEENMVKFRRSIYAVKDITKGELFNSSNIRRIRPGNGIEPKYFESIVGKKALKDIEFGTALSWDMIND